MAKKIVLMHNKKHRSSSLKTSSAVSVLLTQSVQVSRTVKNMEQTLLISNADSVAQLLNGSAGAIPTFVKSVTRANAKVTMFLSILKINYLNVVERIHAHLRFRILQMVTNTHSDVRFAETFRRTQKTSEARYII